MILLALGLIGALPFLICIVVFLRARQPGSFALRLARAVGFCSLCIVPAILLQDLILLAGWTSTSFRFSTCLWAWPFQIWVLLGGGLVQQVFEASAKAISGHRQSTMMDNWHIYYAYTLAWILPWSALIAVRMRTHDWRKDPLAWFVALVVFCNAAAGARWPWWGT